MMQKEIEKTIDRFKQEKLYLQLTRLILDQIHSGKWERGSKILTEEELCNKYNVSKITVRQAINSLVSEGYLIKVQGKGTFVNSVLPVVGLAMKTRLAEDMFGKEVLVQKEVLFRGRRSPSPEAEGFLKTGSDDVYYILSRRIVGGQQVYTDDESFIPPVSRRRIIGGQPIYIDESFIPYEILPDAESIDFELQSLYTVLQEKGTKAIFKVVQTIEILQSYGDSAKHLYLKEDEPVLVVHRLLLGSDAAPIAYTRFLGKSDKYKFQIELERMR